MAIEISLRDGIDPAIQTKMESLAGVAKRLEDQVKSLQKSLGHLNAGGLNSAGAAIQARMGGGSSSNRGRSSYESAFVTAQKQQQKTRDEIAKVFNDGFLSFPIIRNCIWYLFFIFYSSYLLNKMFFK